ncbi:putative RNA-binding protein [Lachnellula occidentalis]|uniref:Putative RNA-binding protein n=1 Tax=Lachnellula occidentalis TaxID=215460 RepID=A0A8H8S6Z7_9HELO|nr:putative RNA-binding protein [Lachnellula occidentalis]
MGASTKKGSNDATRAERKAKKRKAEDAIPDLPGEDVVAEEKPKEKKRKRSADEDVVEEEKAAKKEKKSKSKKDKDAVEDVDEDKEAKRAAKKAKKASKAEPSETSAVELPVQEPVTEEEAPKKSKKERKAERKAKEAAETAAAANGTAAKDPTSKEEVAGDGDAEEKKSKKNNRNRAKKRDAAAKGTGEEGEKAAAAARFICFIGNLPFSATKESLQKHFASVKPKSVRLLTKKEKPTESKGCAFVEFDGYDHMKTCLKLFHHSMFDDGVSPSRKINVELTAGGGGNTQERRQKIEGKNQKLNEQRFRRIQEEEKVKLEKKDAPAIDESAIHPSRRTQVRV